MRFLGRENEWKAVLLTDQEYEKATYFQRKDEFNFGCTQLAFLKGIQVKQDLALDL